MARVIQLAKLLVTLKQNLSNLGWSQVPYIYSRRDRTVELACEVTLQGLHSAQHVHVRVPDPKDRPLLSPRVATVMMQSLWFPSLCTLTKCDCRKQTRRS